MVFSWPVYRPSSTDAENWKKNGTVVKQKKAIQGWAQKILSMFDKELNNNIYQETYSRRHFDWKYAAFVGSKVQKSKQHSNG